MIEIRHAEPQDAEKIREVALKTWKNTYSDILPEEVIEEVMDDWYSVEDLQDQVNHPLFYVATVDNEVAGFVHVTKEEGKATLHRIYLDPDYHGEGIGTRMYEKVETELDDAVEVIELEVFAENKKGKSFYVKHGFETVKTEKIEFRGTEAEQNIMEKRL